MIGRRARLSERIHGGSGPSPIHQIQRCDVSRLCCTNIKYGFCTIAMSSGSVLQRLVKISTLDYQQCHICMASLLYKQTLAQLCVKIGGDIIMIHDMENWRYMKISGFTKPCLCINYSFSKYRSWSLVKLSEFTQQKS